MVSSGDVQVAHINAVSSGDIQSRPMTVASPGGGVQSAHVTVDSSGDAGLLQIAHMTVASSMMRLCPLSPYDCDIFWLCTRCLHNKHCMVM